MTMVEMIARELCWKQDLKAMYVERPEDADIARIDARWSEWAPIGRDVLRRLSEAELSEGQIEAVRPELEVDLDWRPSDMVVGRANSIWSAICKAATEEAPDVADYDYPYDDEDDDTDAFECAAYWTGTAWHCPIAGTEDCDWECRQLFEDEQT